MTEETKAPMGEQFTPHNQLFTQRAPTPAMESYLQTTGSSVSGAGAVAFRNQAQGGDFGWALAQLKAGLKVARHGWNGKDMFLFLVPGSTFQVSRPPLLGIYPAGTSVDYCPHVDMKTADGKVVPWLCSQTDMLATDWEWVA